MTNVIDEQVIVQIRNRCFIEDLPFHCDIDVFCFKLKNDKLLSDKDLIFYNNQSDKSNSLKVLPVGDLVYDCDFRMVINNKKLTQERNTLKLICCPDFSQKNNDSNIGYFEIEINHSIIEFDLNLNDLDLSLNSFSKKNTISWKSHFEIESYPMLVLEIDFLNDLNFKVDFPKRNLEQNINDIIEQFL